MSDDSDLQAFLDSGGGQPPAPPDKDDLQAFLDSGGSSHTPAVLAQADAEKRKAVYDPTRPALGDSIENSAHALISGAYHGVLSGYKGLSTLAATRDPDAAADAVKAEQAKAYQPPAEDLSGASGPVRSSIEQMHQMPAPTAMGDAAGGLAEKLGASPGLSTAINVGANALPMALAPRPEEAGPMGNVAANAQEIVNRSHAQQNMGAAASAADVTKAPPEIQQAIVDAGNNLNHDVLDKHLEASKLPIPVQLTKGQATRNPAQFSAELNARGKSPALGDRFNQQNEALIGNLDEIRREAAPLSVGNDHVQNGQALLDKYKEYDAPIKAEVSANYKALADANGGDLPVNGKAFADAADAALKKQMKAPFLPAPVKSILDSVRDGGDFTYENFENLRTTLAAEARKAERGGDGNAASAINLTRNALEQLPMSGASGPIKALADKARNSAKARFDEIDADPAYKAAVNDDAAPGEASPLADDFVKKYVIGGKKANLDLMKQKFSADPEAQGTIKAAALNYLKSKAGIDAYSNEGNFSQHGYNKGLADLEPRMKSLLDPDTADQVRALGNVARNVKAAPAGNTVNHSNTFTAMAGEHAKDLATGIIDAHTLGFGGKIINRLTKGRADEAFVNDALAPGAGISK